MNNPQPAESSPSETPNPVPVLSYAPDTSDQLVRVMTLVSWGVFVSTLAQTATLGRQPIQAILKDQLLVDATKMSAFMSLANLAWYFKPVAGIFTDNVPIAGLRRRYYLIGGAVLAAAAWMLMPVVPRTYGMLLLIAVVMNVMLVVVSTTTGGILVEAGQKLGATGRLSGARSVLLNVAVIVGGPIGGFLATRALAWTASVNATMVLTLVPLVLFLLREPRVVRAPDASPLRDALRQSWRTVRSGPLWAAAALLFLVHLAPGFSTPLYYHMRDHLKYSVEFLGYIDAVQGVAGVLASLLYVWLCKRMSLRKLYALAIFAAAAGAIPYLALGSRGSAIVITFIYYMGMILADVASLDLAARATPKGGEATGYAVMIGVWNIGIGASDLIGSALYSNAHVAFPWLVWINAGSTALVLLAVPFLPNHLMRAKEGESTAV